MIRKKTKKNIMERRIMREGDRMVVPNPTNSTARIKRGLKVRKSNRKAMTKLELESSKLYFNLEFNM